MKKLTKGIMYAGGLIGSFAAGALFIAANLIANHETAEGANLVVNDERMKVTFIGLRERHFKPGVYPGIFEVKEKNH